MCCCLDSQSLILRIYSVDLVMQELAFAVAMDGPLSVQRDIIMMLVACLVTVDCWEWSHRETVQLGNASFFHHRGCVVGICAHWNDVFGQSKLDLDQTTPHVASHSRH